jgi:hypothetical protein
MGERRLVALLKELLSLTWEPAFSINISPLRGFFRHTRFAGLLSQLHSYPLKGSTRQAVPLPTACQN